LLRLPVVHASLNVCSVGAVVAVLVCMTGAVVTVLDERRIDLLVIAGSIGAGDSALGRAHCKCLEQNGCAQCSVESLDSGVIGEGEEQKV
jgi:hypothetical protein